MPNRITVSDLTGLKPKEINFVIEYCKDFSARRAAEASGYAADTGYNLKEMKNIENAINIVLASRLESSHIDAEWLLMEAVDNHKIARQRGNISASNTALGIIAKHKHVDAYAAEQIIVNSDQDIMDRLQRGRKRMGESNTVEPVVSFL